MNKEMNDLEFVKPNSGVFTSWQKQGVEFHWWTGSAIQHVHNDFYEFFILTHGTCEHKSGRAVYRLGKKAFIFMPRFSGHEIISLSEKPCIHMNFSVDKILLRALCDIINPLLYEKLSEKTDPVILQLNESEFTFF